MSTQPELFDSLEFVGGSTVGQAHNRNLIGAVAAEVAVRVLRASPLLIDGRKRICPDFTLGGYFGEIKSCIRGKRALAYKHRLEKEALHYDPMQYMYAFVSHCASSKAIERSAVIKSFCRGVDVHCCTLSEVAALLVGREVRKVKVPEGLIDPRIGYFREGYCDGFYEFKVSELSWLDGCEERIVKIAGAQTACRVYISEGWKRILP